MENKGKLIINIILWAGLGAFMAYTLSYHPLIGGLLGGAFGAFFRKGCGT